MVAQHLAFGHGARVATLTSIMSTTGGHGVGRTHPQARWVLTTPTPVRDRDDYLDHVVAVATTIGTPDRVDAAARARAAVSWDRGVHPHGTARQLLAIRADGDRTARLAAVQLPTLVVHGDRDPLIDVSGGEATARAVAGARLEVVAGMGHDLPPVHVDGEVVPALLAHLWAHPAPAAASR
ncbi:alpha/beta fold hydrolase [Egicoccus sp. AB-alg6-2]|uniref:alpha/beta fold hydrolase n=1 Tax=Egicoccus sp. AB-alg6-2 TaxID=3242692 RepID=UPI00359D0157